MPITETIVFEELHLRDAAFGSVGELVIKDDILYMADYGFGIRKITILVTTFVKTPVAKLEIDSAGNLYYGWGNQLFM